MKTKTAAELKKGDVILIRGEARTVTFVRKSRRYQGHMMVQYEADLTQYPTAFRCGQIDPASYEAFQVVKEG